MYIYVCAIHILLHTYVYMYALNNSCVPPVKPQHRHVVSLSHVKRRSMLTIFKNDHFAFGV